jgi:hypothetical protein
VLQDPSVPRNARWNIAEVLRSTGDPHAVAVADQYRPSGRRGTGNPESWLGFWIAGILFAGSLVQLGAWPREDQLTRRARLAVVALAVVAVHVLGGIALFVVSVVLTPFAPPLFLIAGIVLVILGPLVPALRAIRREWQLTGLSPTVLAVAAAVGLLLSIYIDRTVYWYLARVETTSLLNALSPLQQAVAWSLPLVASYAPPAWVRAPRP